MRLRSEGFTLVELLVALVMGSFILTAIYQTILTTQRNSAALAERIDVQQFSGLVHAFLGPAAPEFQLMISRGRD